MLTGEQYKASLADGRLQMVGLGQSAVSDCLDR